MLFPVNGEEDHEGKGSHWYLLVLDVKNRRLYQVDSAGGKGNYENTKVLKERCETLYKRMENKEFK